MITIPVELSKNHYQSFLIMNDNCAESSDHITGQHIQGMVLIEAARQMMLSVTENYFLLSQEKENPYFTLNKINTNFLRFTFPVEIVINYQVMNITKKTNGSIKSTCKILFEQLGQTVAEIEIDFCVYSKDIIAVIEKTMAADTLQKALLTESLLSSNRGDTLKIAYA
jgi:hypothetical protein